MNHLIKSTSNCAAMCSGCIRQRPQALRRQEPSQEPFRQFELPDLGSGSLLQHFVRLGLPDKPRFLSRERVRNPKFP